ncbi:MAG: CocE/NonD family hydrolase, partial [Gemmatimonas sp.]|uniref:CocE/NonD family hydrolase n=1 Tax=Gemmatimonas sp. TaxID=1962908 RepID=UPI003919ABC8
MPAARSTLRVRLVAPLLLMGIASACRSGGGSAAGTPVGRVPAGGAPVGGETVPATYVFAFWHSLVTPGFADSSQWVRERLWVETEFDSDYDGRKDRVHVDVTRPGPTASGLKVPVVYETSPYFAGTDPNEDLFGPVTQELGAPPPSRTLGKGAAYNAGRTRISNSQVRTWVPRGFAVVHSESPGTGLS